MLRSTCGCVDLFSDRIYSSISSKHTPLLTGCRSAAICLAKLSCKLDSHCSWNDFLPESYQDFSPFKNHSFNWMLAEKLNASDRYFINFFTRLEALHWASFHRLEALWGLLLCNSLALTITWRAFHSSFYPNWHQGSVGHHRVREWNNFPSHLTPCRSVDPIDPAKWII